MGAARTMVNANVDAMNDADDAGKTGVTEAAGKAEEAEKAEAAGVTEAAGKAEAAAGFFSNGYNCAQSVLGALCEELGLELDTALRLASGFGGGVRCGELCGAVSGAILAIGLKCGYCKKGDMAQKGYCNKKTHEFVEKFREANGSIICRELLGADVRCPDDHNSPGAKAAHKTVCPGLVASAVRVLEGMEFESAKTDSLGGA